MIRNYGQEDPEPLRGKLIHHSLPIGDASTAKKFLRAVGRKAYTALSYVWGDPSHTDEIIIDNHKVPITHSLYTALRQLQSDALYGEEVIWVDALCINQADDIEKSAQIRIMREVYHNAGNVRVWLGPGLKEDADKIYEVMQWIITLTDGFLPEKYEEGGDAWYEENSTEVTVLPFLLKPVGLMAHTALGGRHKISMFKETFKTSDNERIGKTQLLKQTDGEQLNEEYLQWRPRQKDLEKFMKLVPEGDLSMVVAGIERYIIAEPEWFSRIWVVQEVGVAWDDIDVCRGPYNVEWRNMLQTIFYLHYTCNVPFPSIDKITKLEVIRLGFSDGRRSRLCDLMYECRYRQASNPRDKIYGLYGLMGDQENEFTKPDYSKSIEEIYAHITFHFITQAKSLNPICGQQRFGKRKELPSWVPDYELDLQKAPAYLLPKDDGEALFHASGYDSEYALPDPQMSFVEWSILPTQGIRIGKVAYLSEISDDGEPFGQIQGRWRRTLDLHLQSTSSDIDQKVKYSLDGVGKLINQYSAYYTSNSLSLISADIPESPVQKRKPLPSPEVNTADPLTLSYLNILITGRSTPTTRATAPYIPPFPQSTSKLATKLATSLLPQQSTLVNSRTSTIPPPSTSTDTNNNTNPSFYPTRPSRSLISSPSTTTSTDLTTAHPSDVATNAKISETCLSLHSGMSRKRFFVTETGEMGSGPEEMSEGDAVVVLFGCGVPVVLREVGGGDGVGKEMRKRWEFVGEAFVDGFMDAEALAWFRRGKGVVEEFGLV